MKIKSHVISYQVSERTFVKKAIKTNLKSMRVDVLASETPAPRSRSPSGEGRRPWGADAAQRRPPGPWTRPGTPAPRSLRTPPREGRRPWGRPAAPRRTPGTWRGRLWTFASNLMAAMTTDGGDEFLTNTSLTTHFGTGYH